MLKPIILPIHRIHYLHRQGVIIWILRHPKNLRILEMDVRDIHWISISAEQILLVETLKVISGGLDFDSKRQDRLNNKEYIRNRVSRRV